MLFIKSYVRKICVPFGTKFQGDCANYLWDLIVHSKVALTASHKILIISPAIYPMKAVL